MRVALYVLAFVAAFVVVRAWPRSPGSSTSRAVAAQMTGAPGGVRASPTPTPHDSSPRAVARAATPAPATMADLGPLRNAVIMAAAEDLHHRGADLRTCLPGVELVGVTKLVFAVTVEPRAARLVATGWRFVEVLDGQALPPTFAACAASVFGGPHVLAKDAALPADFTGSVDVVYLLQ